MATRLSPETRSNTNPNGTRYSDWMWCMTYSAYCEAVSTGTLGQSQEISL